MACWTAGRADVSVRIRELPHICIVLCFLKSGAGSQSLWLCLSAVYLRSSILKHREFDCKFFFFVFFLLDSEHLGEKAPSWWEVLMLCLGIIGLVKDYGLSSHTAEDFVCVVCSWRSGCHWSTCNRSFVWVYLSGNRDVAFWLRCECLCFPSDQ